MKNTIWWEQMKRETNIFITRTVLQTCLLFMMWDSVKIKRPGLSLSKEIGTFFQLWFDSVNQSLVYWASWVNTVWGPSVKSLWLHNDQEGMLWFAEETEFLLDVWSIQRDLYKFHKMLNWICVYKHGAITGNISPRVWGLNKSKETLIKWVTH